MYSLFTDSVVPIAAESEEQRNELNFERESRIRVERELKKETQTRSLVEQELQLTKKQYEVYMKLKDTELQNQKQELGKQWAAAKSQEQKESDERLRQVTLDYQQQDVRQQEEFRQQLERKDKQTQMQLETTQLQIQQLDAEKQQLSSQVESSSDRIYELERELQAASSLSAGTVSLSPSLSAAVSDGANALKLADEEKQIYVQQIELLQEQVKELEEEKFKRVQSDMDAGRLASPSSSSPRSSKAKSFGGDDFEIEQARKDVLAKEEAAERTLAMAQEIKREAEEMLKYTSGVTGSHSSSSAEDREKITNVFKEAVNEMFFRFQDYFEDEAAALESKQVLTVIRKVLKQSTKDVAKKLQESQQEKQEDDADDNASDGPPAPPPLELPTAVIAAPAPIAADVEQEEKAIVEKTSRHASSSSAAAADEDAEPISLFMEKMSDRMTHQSSGDVSSSSDGEDDFED